MRKRIGILCLVAMIMFGSIALGYGVIAASKSDVTTPTVLTTKSKTIYVTKGNYVSLQVKTGGKLRKVKWKVSSGSKYGKIIKKNNKLATSYTTKTVKIKGIKKGTAQVRASYKGKTYKAKIVVETPSISNTSITLVKGKSKTLKISGTKRKKAWGTTNKAIASVTTSGKVTGMTAGTCKVVGVVGSVPYYCSVRVLDISQNDLTLQVGTSQELSILGKSNGKKVTWKSNNTNVAKVDKDGNVSAVGVGECKITGKVHGKTLICSVAVSNQSVYKAKYTYEVKLLNQYPVYTTYGEKKLDGTSQSSDLSFAYVYIKTNNPNPYTIYLENPRGITFMKDFQDVELTLLDGVCYGAALHKVNGGYLGQISLKTTGNNSIEVREVAGAYNDPSYKPSYSNAWKQDVNSQRVATLSIPNVKSYSATEKAWYQSVIKAQTTSSMTEKQKMDAIVSYLSTNFKYFACSLSPNEYLPLISHEGAYWDTKEVDCVRYCYMVNNFASFLGIKGVSTYAGYSNHYYSTVTFSDGSTKAYDNAPNSYSNIVTDWKMLDE